MKFMRLINNQSASTTVEFAFALPVLLIVMLGTFQLGLYLNYTGALKHAAGEGIRLAKVDSSADSDAIRAKVESEMITLDPANITGFSFTRGTSNGASFGTVAISYRMEAVMPLVPVPDITISQSKTAFLPS